MQAVATRYGPDFREFRGVVAPCCISPVLGLYQSRFTVGALGSASCVRTSLKSRFVLTKPCLLSRLGSRWTACCLQ